MKDMYKYEEKLIERMNNYNDGCWFESDYHFETGYHLFEYPRLREVLKLIENRGRITSSHLVLEENEFDHFFLNRLWHLGLINPIDKLSDICGLHKRIVIEVNSEVFGRLFFKVIRGRVGQLSSHDTDMDARNKSNSELIQAFISAIYRHDPVSPCNPDWELAQVRETLIALRNPSLIANGYDLPGLISPKTLWFLREFALEDYSAEQVLTDAIEGTEKPFLVCSTRRPNFTTKQYEYENHYFTA